MEEYRGMKSMVTTAPKPIVNLCSHIHTHRIVRQTVLQCGQTTDGRVLRWRTASVRHSPLREYHDALRIWQVHFCTHHALAWTKVPFPTHGFISAIPSSEAVPLAPPPCIS